MAASTRPRWRAAAGRVAVVAVLANVLGVGVSTGADATPSPSPPPAAAAAAESCTVSAMLVNPCRPWLGAVAESYPELGGFRSQIEGHEQRIGRPLDVAHGFHSPGQVHVTDDERALAAGGRILYLNWRPATRWIDGGGRDSASNARIDTFARDIKTLGSRRIMLALAGEPERHTTAGTSSCPNLSGTAGSPAEYRAMWANVQDRFAAAGVSNVVWVMNYLGYAGWRCLVPELWPGNARVDWIVWDPYVGPGQRWNDMVGYFYAALEAGADATHDYTSKPWGLAEFGYWWGVDQREAYRFYDDALAFVRAGRHPRLKLYEVFDASSGWVDARISYTAAGAFDPVEQAHYNSFANDPALGGRIAAGADHFAACDTSVEVDLSCFSGSYDGTVFPERTSPDAMFGTESAEITTERAGAPSSFGLNASPVPVRSTEAGRRYEGRAWVRASRVGLPITLLLRERRPVTRTAPPGGFATLTWKATDTSWHLLRTAHRAQEGGNELTYSVYGSTMVDGDFVRADGFGLTSAAPK